MKIIIAFLSVCFFSVGCKPSVEEQGGQGLKEPLVVVRKASTAADWKAALDSTFVIGKTTDQGDGVIEFHACFDQKSKCELFVFGRRDSFQKVRVFKGFFSSMDVLTYLKTSVVLLDNQLPKITFQPYFFGKNGWLFLNKIAIMADGEIILERAFEGHEVSRDNSSIGVEERASVVVTHSELAALRNMAMAKVVMVRFTGSKGYVALKPGDVDNVKKEVASALLIYDKLTTALTDNLPQAAAAAP